MTDTSKNYPAPVWTHQQQLQALEQGWGVFNNSDHGTQIERLDDLMLFDGDATALAYVQGRAAEGCLLSISALRFVEYHAQK